jgi:hypothetical protein
MTNGPIVILFIFFLVVLLPGCKESVHNITPLFQKDTSQLNERKNTLFAFVGEKITVQAVPTDPDAMDGAVEAVYRVLVPVYGCYEKDTVRFTAYDHYGYFGFAHSQYALLYLSKYKGAWYHEKYQFTAVYRTDNGRWAGNGGDISSMDTTIHPEKINFAERGVHHTMIIDLKGQVFDMGYDTPYFRKEGYPPGLVYGNYIEQLFLLRKNGVLRYRNLFGNSDYVFPGVQLEEIADPRVKKHRRHQK